MPSRTIPADVALTGYHDQLPVRPSPWAGLGRMRSCSFLRSRLSIEPCSPVPTTSSSSHTDWAGDGRPGSSTVGSTVELGVTQPSRATEPTVGSASTLNVFGPSLRVKTGEAPWVALRPGTSLAVCTMTLMGVAYFTQSGLVVSKMMLLPVTLAENAVRAWR